MFQVCGPAQRRRRTRPCQHEPQAAGLPVLWPGLSHRVTSRSHGRQHGRRTCGPAAAAGAGGWPGVTRRRTAETVPEPPRVAGVRRPQRALGTVTMTQAPCQWPQHTGAGTPWPGTGTDLRVSFTESRWQPR